MEYTRARKRQRTKSGAQPLPEGHDEISSIVEYKLCDDGSIMVLVRWTGYGSEDDQWVRYEDVNAPILMERYISRQLERTQQHFNILGDLLHGKDEENKKLKQDLARKDAELREIRLMCQKCMSLLTSGDSEDDGVSDDSDATVLNA